jgi:glycosyltransferase involved in cell wall biosynthesis
LPNKLVFAGVSETNQAYWRRLYPNARARWISYVGEDDLPSIVQGAFCLAQPSTAEGYGYPPLEAMACGVPAVISSISVLIETTGGNALYASPGNPKEWIDAFNRLRGEDIYNEQVEKGLTWVEPFRGRKGWKKHVSDIIELLKEA